MSADTTDAPRDYRPTLFLPDTEFPMKAGLPRSEPERLRRWAAIDLYRRLREDAKGRPHFILHDGPPYANGHLHIGHALNKILKDFVVRSQQMLGRDAAFVPGWDCHGLPIEWKVEEAYRAEGRAKDDVDPVEFRRACRDFAGRWLDIQREEAKRFGCLGDWERPYSTMDFAAEATILRELHRFKDAGLLYRGFKPVMWSVVERTALAEAEIEYHEKKSPTIHVRFPVVRGPEAMKGASVVIWTTTPWTIPGNRAIAFSTSIPYGLYEITGTGEDARARSGERLLLADSLAAQTLAHAGATDYRRLGDADPSGLVCAHPLHAQGYGFDVPLLPGDHVTDDTGTGFVHTAPGHGEEDFELGRTHGIEVPLTVLEDGAYAPSVPLFAGRRVLADDGSEGDANGAVIGALTEAGALLAKGTLRHQYPHSWRSKAPVIFRATPQWFIALDKPFTLDGRTATLRERALEAIDAIAWTPASARTRIRSMVESRPDWVISRQRAWGVPIAIFADPGTGEVLNDPAVDARIEAAFEKEGADAWFAGDPQRFLGNDHDPGRWKPVSDILDVWFDSGSTHAFVLEGADAEAKGVSWPADLYLEGSDQHRGWFQSSLLESCGTRGRAPYRAAVTHGFTLDEKGRKMSKSLGNAVDPQEVIAQHGADVLRLWAATVDAFNDQTIGAAIIKEKSDAYRRLRNTLRFLLANLKDFEEHERIARAGMPELERYVLHRLAETDARVRAAFNAYDFAKAFKAVFELCTNDLSSFYLDVRKDALYCDTGGSVRRRAARTVLDEALSRLTAWLAPMLCFTAEEVWAARHRQAPSVHLRQIPEVPDDWLDSGLARRWARIRMLRRVVTGALEIARRDKLIGSSLEARAVLHVTDAADAALFEANDLAEIAIVSNAAVETGPLPADAFTLDDVAGAAASVARADGEKCARCWMVLPEVGTIAGAQDLCARCADAVAAGGAP